MRLTQLERETRFWGRIQKGKPDECWLWKGRAGHDRYGRSEFYADGQSKTVGTHRIAFYYANGRFPAKGMDTMHSCDVKLCCNPSHLSEGTRSQNMKDVHARGLYPRKPGFVGSAHPRSKVNEKDVVIIRSLFLCRDWSRRRAGLCAKAGPWARHTPW